MNRPRLFHIRRPDFVFVPLADDAVVVRADVINYRARTAAVAVLADEFHVESRARAGILNLQAQCSILSVHENHRGQTRARLPPVPAVRRRHGGRDRSFGVRWARRVRGLEQARRF